jgi:integrase
VILYQQKGHSLRFTGPLTRHFHARQLGSITDLDVMQFCQLAYPNATPQTINRQVYSPLIAIWRVAHAAGMCGPHEFRRPKQPEREAVTFATEEEIGALLDASHDRLRAAVLLLSFTGARASEVCRLMPEDVDWTARAVMFRKTKGGKPRLVPLGPMVMEALVALRLTSGPLCGFKQRWSLNQAIERACVRAGLRHLTSHEVGRHAFAARLLRQGKTLKEVQEAGGWSAKSMWMVAEIYAHLERSSTDAAVRDADRELQELSKPSERRKA